jgi:hypothetical protein
MFTEPELRTLRESHFYFWELKQEEETGRWYIFTLVLIGRILIKKKFHKFWEELMT